MKPFDKKLVLENGQEFYGYGFGAERQVIYELVFNTSMVGYQEIVSDPSYTDQIVCMTYPLIGNYGMNDEDYEAKVPTMGGMIVREYNDIPSNFRCTKTLSEVLEDYQIPAISGVDTRKITKIIRDEGTQKAIICNADVPYEEALKLCRECDLQKDVVGRVSTKQRWYSRTPHHKFDVVVIDCGIKQSFIKKLNEKGCNVTVVPFDITSEEILKLSPDGLLLSNGPGNPEDMGDLIAVVKELKGKIPMFGIDLGHQILCLAEGAKTYKMKFGHRGSNHPVKNLETGKIEISSQNHGFVVDADSIEGTGLEITHINILDKTVEGVKSKADKLFSVQYHPQDEYLFDTFIDLMTKEREENA